MNTPKPSLRLTVAAGALSALLAAACKPAQAPTATVQPAPPTTIAATAVPTTAPAATEVAATVAPTAQAPATEAAPIEDAAAVVTAFTERVNAGDRAGALALIAPGACIGYGSDCFSPERLTGWWESDIFGPQGQIVDFELTASGDQITLLGQYNSNGWSGQADYVFTVEDGLITAWSMR